MLFAIRKRGKMLQLHGFVDVVWAGVRTQIIKVNLHYHRGSGSREVVLFEEKNV